MFKKLSLNLGRIFISSGSASPAKMSQLTDHVFVCVQTWEKWWNGVPIPRFSLSELYFLHFRRIFSHLVKLCPLELWLIPCLKFLLKMVSCSGLEAESFQAVKEAFQLEGAVGCTMERAWLSLSRRTVSCSCPLTDSVISIWSGNIRVCFLLILEEWSMFQFSWCCIKGWLP